MANTIRKNNEFVWRCSNGMLSVLYETLVILCQVHNLKQNSKIFNLIQKLNQDFYGFGCINIDINDYFSSKDDLANFALLFKEAIDLLNKKNKWPKEMFDHAMEFYNQLNK